MFVLFHVAVFVKSTIGLKQMPHPMHFIFNVLWWSHFSLVIEIETAIAVATPFCFKVIEMTTLD
jgi:hypothetical protein